MTALIDSIRIAPNPDSKPEKMSKSRGNVITIQEVVRRVSSIKDGYEFRDHHGNVIDDPLRLEIWRDYDEQFYCGSRWNCLKSVPGFEIMQKCYAKLASDEDGRTIVRDNVGKPAFKNIPVFLHRVGNEVPLTFHVGERFIQQHPNCLDLWNRLYESHPDEFVDIPDSKPFFTVATDVDGYPIDAGIYSRE